MCLTVKSDESVSADRSAHVARHTDHSSRRPKEQVSASKNAQTEYATHLSQNATYSSTYGPSTTPLDQHASYRERSVDTKENQRDVTRNAEETEQKHKSVDTRDLGSSKSCCVKLRLWCLRFCRAKKRYSQRVLRKSRRYLGRIKAQSKECRSPDDATMVAGVSTMPHRESISHRDAPKKSRRNRKQDETVEVVDKDVFEKTFEEKERKERRKRKREERRRREIMEEEEEERHRREKRIPRPVTRDNDLVVEDQAPVKPITEEERHQRNERVPHPVDARPLTRDNDLVVEDQVPAKLITEEERHQREKRVLHPVNARSLTRDDDLAVKDQVSAKLMTQEEEERHQREERVPHPVDARSVTRDDDLVVEDQVPVKPPSIADHTKTCCYLCAQNTLAIATATTAVSRPEQSDKCVQVSTHKFHAETSPTLDKSCSPMLLLVRTVQSSVKVRTRETSALCPSTSALPRERETGPRAKKRKKFTMFPRLTRTKCPAGRHAVCETDKSTARRDDNAEKREPRNVRCRREKNV